MKNKNKIRTSISSILFIMVCCITSCITNDIPYPIVRGNFTSFEVEGQLETPQIDSVNRIVTIKLTDTIDIKQVKVISYQLTANTEITPTIEEYLNLSQPNTFTLRTWQDYTWTIKGEQTIDRKIETKNSQTKKPVFNDKNFTALVYVPETEPLNKIIITKMQLGPSNSVITPDYTTITDFSKPQKFTVKYRNVVEEWTVVIMQSSEVVATGEADPWGKFAYLYGTITTGVTDKPGFEYKKSDASEWIKVTDNVIQDNNSISMKIGGLESETTYQYRAVLGANAGETKTFTTEKVIEVPNLNFDTWTQSGKNWFANADAADSYWASGNTGVTSSLAGSRNAITSPEEVSVVKGKAAKLISIDGVTMVGAAAGNLFIGSYKTNAFEPVKSVTFGRPYTGARPTKLSGWYKYTSMPITHKGDHPAGLQNDIGNIYIFFTDQDGKEIARGNLDIPATVSNYTKFEIEIVYTDKKAKPAKIAIVATSSKYGGDFDGMKVSGAVGAGSTLWVDEFELSYE